MDNKEIRRLNRGFLGRNNVTDVIAFDLSDTHSDIDGEIVISVEEALRQSRLRKIPLNQEILLYCIHGVLHLIGYDDRTKKDQREMVKKQVYYLSKCKSILR